MTRLIDADALMNKFRNADANGINLAIDRYALKSIEDAPTVDAEPVRHGKWANDAVGVLRCSECNTQAPWRFVSRGYNEVDYRWKSDYCPNCGADMRGEE